MTTGCSHGVVLAAGLGTRLRPLTYVRAKAAIPLIGEPLIRRVVTWLATHRVTKLVVNLHYRPETITAVLGTGEDLGAEIRYSWEGATILGSAGGPRLALPLLEADPFLIVNGDTLTDIDLNALAAAHASGGALVTMALVPIVDPLRYGGVRLDSRGHVTAFVPRGPDAAGSWHFTGVQVASAEAFRSVPEGTAAATVGGLYEQLIAARPGSIRGWVSTAAFFDIGTVADYWRTSAGLSAGKAIMGLGRSTEVDSSAQVRRAILWDDVVVERGCVLEDCIVTDGVRVREGASYRQAIVWRQGDTVTITPFAEVGVHVNQTRSGFRS